MPEKCTEPCGDLRRLERALDRLQEQNSETYREIFQRLNDLDKVEAAQVEQFITVNGKLDKLLAWQENQRDKPAKRWETVVSCALSSLAGAFLLWLAAGMPGVGR